VGKSKAEIHFGLDAGEGWCRYTDGKAGQQVYISPSSSADILTLGKGWHPGSLSAC
jgi:hypothetical protein